MWFYKQIANRNVTFCATFCCTTCVHRQTKFQDFFSENILKITDFSTGSWTCGTQATGIHEILKPNSLTYTLAIGPFMNHCTIHSQVVNGSCHLSETCTNLSFPFEWILISKICFHDLPSCWAKFYKIKFIMEKKKIRVCLCFLFGDLSLLKLYLKALPTPTATFLY